MITSYTRRRPGARVRMDSPRLAMVALAAGVGAVLGLAGCSAGMVTQTDTQVAPVPGADVEVGDVVLRNVLIQYGGTGGYAAGDDAPLVVRIFNNSMEPVTLTGVSADKAASVNLVGTPTVVTPTTSPTVPPDIASPSPTAEASPAPDGSPEASPSPEDSPSPTKSPSPTAAPEPQPISIVIPPVSYVLLVPGEGDIGHLVLTSLTQAIVPGEFVTVTFTFDNGAEAVVPVPLAPPIDEVPRATPVYDPGHGGGPGYGGE